MKSKFLWISLLTGTSALAQDPVTVDLEAFVLGLTHPVAIANAGDERLFIAEQEGYIKTLNSIGEVSPTLFLDIHTRVNSGGEQGLLGLAFDPNYNENGFFYVYYIFGNGNGTSRISRFSVTANPDSAAEASEQVIYSWPQPFSNHNGGDLHFGPDGYLYVGFGDGGSGGDPDGHAQDLTDPLGDMIRIDVSDPDTTYTIPPTNPFATSAGNELPEIWASGLRNPFRWGFDALTGDLWIGDVGQNAYEEVDFWPAGAEYNSHPNFGWNCYEGLHDFSSAGCVGLTNYVPPVAEHGQSAFGWYSVMGGRVYRGSEFPHLEGRYFYTDYVGGQFYSLRPDGNGGFIRELVRNVSIQGLACIAENSAGELFVANVSSGTIFRLVDACPVPPAAPIVDLINGALVSTVGSSYKWYLNGNIINGATSQTYVPQMNGSYTVLVTTGPCQVFSEPYVLLNVGLVDVTAPQFQMQPVPAKDVLVLSQLPAASYLVRITDTTGRIVMDQATSGAKERVTLNVAELQPGNYVVSILAQDGQVLQHSMIMVAR